MRFSFFMYINFAQQNEWKTFAFAMRSFVDCWFFSSLFDSCCVLCCTIWVCCCWCYGAVGSMLSLVSVCGARTNTKTLGGSNRNSFARYRVWYDPIWFTECAVYRVRNTAKRTRIRIELLFFYLHTHTHNHTHVQRQRHTREICVNI